MNIWTGDGFKDIPSDRMEPRLRYKESIEAILSEPFDKNLVKPYVESKVFGIGVESYTAGCRSWQKALLFTLCSPNEELKKLQDKNDFSRLMIMQEKIKTMPFSAVWEKYCEVCGVEADEEKWFKEVEKYENEVLNLKI